MVSHDLLHDSRGVWFPVWPYQCPSSPPTPHAPKPNPPPPTPLHGLPLLPPQVIVQQFRPMLNTHVFLGVNGSAGTLEL